MLWVEEAMGAAMPGQSSAPTPAATFKASPAATKSPAATPPASRIGLRVFLVVVAGIETLFGVTEFSGAFDLHNTPLSLGQFLINAKLASHPFFAIAALALAVCGRLRGAIIVLGAYILVAWPAEVETIPRFGIEWSLSPIGLSLFAEQMVFPPLAIAAINLARRDRRLWLAALFVALPPANLLLGITIFTISVIIYGF
jgi:hypothetical protein